LLYSPAFADGSDPRAPRRQKSGRPIDSAMAGDCRRALAEALEPRQMLSVTSASISGPTTGVEGNAVAFNAAATSNFCNGITNWAINWGDGTTGNATVAGSAVLYHTFLDEMNLASISATVTDGDTGSGATAYFCGTSIAITDAALSADPYSGTIGATEGAGFNDSVLHFFDANPIATIADFSAQVGYGDTSLSTAATVVNDPNGGFDVIAPHTFSEEGTFFGNVSVTDDGGQALNAALSSSVVDAPLRLFGTFGLRYDVGFASSNDAVTFTDDDPMGAFRDYTAKVNYGDGTPVSTDVTVSKSNSDFDVVLGPHTYQSAGFFPVTITMTDQGGASFTCSTTASVAGGWIHQLDFSAATPADFHPVSDDKTGTSYSSAQWLDGTSHPIAYTRSGTTNDNFGSTHIVVTAALNVNGFDSGATAYVKASINGGDTNPVTATLTNGQLLATATVTDNYALAASIVRTNETINWFISNDGTHWSPAGTTNNLDYVINAIKLTSIDSYETELNIGCSNATGKTATGDIIDGIWNNSFATDRIDRVDGVLMNYNHQDGMAIDAAGMLKQTTGRGQCTAWTDLLVQVLAAQGVTASPMVVAANQTISASKFTVKLMPAQGSGIYNYTVGTSETNYFRFHEIVSIDYYSDRL